MRSFIPPMMQMTLGLLARGMLMRESIAAGGVAVNAVVEDGVVGEQPGPWASVGDGVAKHDNNVVWAKGVASPAAAAATGSG